MTAQLDPEALALLEVTRAMGTPQPYTVTVSQARAQMRAAFVTKGPALGLHGVSDVAIPTPHGELIMRLYRASPGVLPAALFLHGGGWTLNDIDTHDRLVRRIAKRSGWLIASLHYRRAPEHKHPAALEDAHVAYRWLNDNAARLEADVSQAAVIGESSGATTAAALTLLLRDLKAPTPSFQILAYPLTDALGRWPSHQERGEGYTLDRRLLEWFMDHYLPAGHHRVPDQDQADPYLLPLTATDLSGLPPALVMTAEFDPLRDEGIAYAQRLAAADVPVEHIHAGDQMHGFLLLDRAIARAGELIDQLADALVSHAGRPASVSVSDPSHVDHECAAGDAGRTVH